MIATGTNIPSGGRAIIGLTQNITNNYRSVIVDYSGDIKESTETSTPTSSPSPTPSPSPGPPGWHTLGTYNLACGSNISIPTISSRQFSVYMNSGGGADGRIAYLDCFGTGAVFNFTTWGPQTAINGIWPPVMDVGQTATTNQMPTYSNVSSFTSRVGCCDGESGTFTVSYYGP